MALQTNGVQTYLAPFWPPWLWRPLFQEIHFFSFWIILVSTLLLTISQTEAQPLQGGVIWHFLWNIPIPPLRNDLPPFPSAMRALTRLQWLVLTPPPPTNSSYVWQGIWGLHAQKEPARGSAMPASTSGGSSEPLSSQLPDLEICKIRPICNLFCLWFSENQIFSSPGNVILLFQMKGILI